jgi:hypothetical protein
MRERKAEEKKNDLVYQGTYIERYDMSLHNFHLHSLTDSIYDRI